MPNHAVLILDLDARLATGLVEAMTVHRRYLRRRAEWRWRRPPNLEQTIAAQGIVHRETPRR